MVEQDCRLKCAIRSASEEPRLFEGEQEHPRLRAVDARSIRKALGIAQERAVGQAGHAGNLLLGCEQRLEEALEGRMIGRALARDEALSALGLRMVEQDR